MSSSKKHGNFINEPIGHKTVLQVPGVGPVLGTQLSAKGTTTANNMMGQYLVHNQDPGQFKSWMQSNTSANAKQSSDAFQGLDQHHQRWS